MRNAYKILVRKHEGKTSLERPRRRWENNIKIDLEEIVRGDVDRIHLAQESVQSQALVNTAMNNRVP
jgi:hypothetical protein